jgi:hypothetical protein
MKIPVIQKPAINQRSRDTGARPIQVRANANAFMAEGAALAQLGSTIQQEAMSWGQIQKNIIESEESAAAKSAFQTEVDAARTAVQAFNDPVKAEAEFRRLVQPQLKRITSGGYKSADGAVLSFTTGGSRRKFNATAAALMSSELATVRQVARQRQASSHIANTLGRVDKSVKEIAQMPNGTMRDLRIQMEIVQEFKNLENVGHYTGEQRHAATKRETQRVARLQVEKLLTGADTPEKARQVFNDINSNKYDGLSATAVQDLSERSINLEEALERTRNRDADKATRDGIKEAEKNQKLKYFELFKRVKVEDDDPSGTKELTPEEVEKFYGEQGISKTHRELLIQQIENKGSPIAEDKELVSDIQNKMRQAKTKEELEGLIDELFKSPKIKYETKRDLENYGIGKLSGTDEAKRETLFRNQLTQIAKPDSIIDKMLPGSTRKAESILLRYDAEILDGAKPLDAFQNAIDDLSEGRKANLSSLPRPRFGLEGRKLQDYTAQDVADTIERTKNKLKDKASSLAIELIYLETLERYVGAMTPDERKKQAERIKELTKQAEDKL